jgi:hypothetical protein
MRDDEGTLGFIFALWVSLVIGALIQTCNVRLKMNAYMPHYQLHILTLSPSRIMLQFYLHCGLYHFNV